MCMTLYGTDNHSLCWRISKLPEPGKVSCFDYRLFMLHCCCVAAKRKEKKGKEKKVVTVFVLPCQLFFFNFCLLRVPLLHVMLASWHYMVLQSVGLPDHEYEPNSFCWHELDWATSKWWISDNTHLWNMCKQTGLGQIINWWTWANGEYLVGKQWITTELFTVVINFMLFTAFTLGIYSQYNDGYTGVAKPTTATRYYWRFFFSAWLHPQRFVSVCSLLMTDHMPLSCIVLSKKKRRKKTRARV